MMAMLGGALPLETPSRILRRIQLAQDDEDSHFDSLPSLPHGDTSVEDSSQDQGSSENPVSFAKGSKAAAGKKSANLSDDFNGGIRGGRVEVTPAAPMRDRVLTANGARRNQMPVDQTPRPVEQTPGGLSLPSPGSTSPYSSTPATATYQDSQQSRTIIGNQSAGDETAFGPAPTTRSGWSRQQLQQSRRGIEADLSEAGMDEESAIGKVEAADDMQVLSGSGSENEAPAMPRAQLRRSSGSGYKSSPLAKVVEERTEELREDSSLRDGSGSDGSDSEADGSLPRKSVGDLDLDDLDDLESDVDESALGRPSSPKGLDVDPAAHDNEESFSPRRSAASYLTSPGVGRRASPQPGGHRSYSIDIGDPTADDESSRGLRSATPFSAMSHSIPGKEPTRYATPKPQIFRTLSADKDEEDNADKSAAPGNTPANAALEKRKSHLLSTLRLTAVRSATRARAVKGTPFVKRTRLEPDLGGGEDSLDDLRIPNATAISHRTDEDGEPASDASTTHDLTTFAPAEGAKSAHRHTNGNISFPDGGAEQHQQSQRFNGAKLNAYLHTLNTRLTEENQSLIKTLGETNRENVRLRRKNEDLEEEVRMVSVVGVGSDADDDRRRKIQADGDRSEQLNDQLEGLVKSHQGIASLQSRLQAAAPSADNNSSDQVALLTAQLDRMQGLIASRDADIKDLRTQLTEARSKTFGSVEDAQEDYDKLASTLQKENFTLRDEISGLESVQAEKDNEIASLRLDLVNGAGRNAATDLEVQASLDEALQSLEEKEQEVDDLKIQVEEQSESFTRKMRHLKDELCKVMDEQDAKLTAATREVEDLKAERAAREEEVSIKQKELERRLEEATVDLAEARQQRPADGDESLEVGRLEAAVANKERMLQDAATEAAQRVQQHASEISALRDELDAAKQAEDDAVRHAKDAESALKQMEDALDESEKQMLEYEEQSATLKAKLDVAESEVAAQKSSIAALEAKLSQALRTALNQSTSSSHFSPRRTPTRASSIGKAAKTGQAALISTLEEELDEAYREIDRLKGRLAAADAIAESEIQQLKIKTLETHKMELEDRVTSLRQQAILGSPSKTPGRSVMFKSLAGIKTPKTPGAMLANMTVISPYSPGPDGTISPLLAQIHQLEQQVTKLQEHLGRANANVDEKLQKLEDTGLSTIKLAEQLAKSKKRIAELEDQLDALLGKNGIVLRVQRRLANLHCPDCETVFNANDIVRFRVRADANTIELPEDDTTTRVHDALASVNAKLRDLQAENAALRSASDRTADAARRHNALRSELTSARSEVSRLAAELKSERSRLRAHAEGQSSLLQERAAVEDQLRQLERTLSNVIVELTRATKARDAAKAQVHGDGRPSAASKHVADLQVRVDRLRSEKADLISEKSSLVSRLADLEASALPTASFPQRMQKRIEEQSEELHQLRGVLEDKSGEIVKLRDEREHILRGVVSLQADLKRVQEEAKALGEEMGHFQEDTEEVDGKTAADLRRELGDVKRELRLTVQGQSDPRAMARLAERHSQECKGLLLRIRYLKVLFTRESMFRADLAKQKTYLSDRFEDAEARTLSIQRALAEFGLPCGVDDTTIRPTEQTLKGAATAVRALCRMRILARKWQKEQTVKRALKSAYAEVRGKELES